MGVMGKVTAGQSYTIVWEGILKPGRTGGEYDDDIAKVKNYILPFHTNVA